MSPTLKEKRKSKGLCIDCGSKLDTNFVRCRRCNMINNLRTLEWRDRNKLKVNLKKRIQRQKRIEKGLCRDCPNLAEPGLKYCRECIQKGTVRKQNSYLAMNPESYFW